MKTINKLSIIGIFILLLLGNKPLYESKNNEIGSITYSILTPDLFRLEHGKGWVLLDGGEDLKSLGIQIKDTELCLIHGVCDPLPDARGYFFRSHDNRLDEKTRVDKQRNSDAKIGSVQLDAFQGHAHSSLYEVIYLKKPVEGDIKGATEGGNKDTWGKLGGIMDGYTSDNKNGYGKPNHSFETRPKNLNFYTYIKVNKY